MKTQTKSDAPIGEILILIVTLAVIVRRMAVPRTVASGVTHTLSLPKVLIGLLGSAVGILGSAFSLLLHGMGIMRAGFSVLLIGGIVTRLITLFNDLRARPLM